MKKSIITVPLSVASGVINCADIASSYRWYHDKGTEAGVARGATKINKIDLAGTVT
jgi:hypothetical protein